MSLPPVITIDAAYSSIRKNIKINCPNFGGNSFSVYVDGYYQGDIRYSDKWNWYPSADSVLNLNDVQVLGDIVERNGYVGQILP